MNKFILFFAGTFFLSGCIGDDLIFDEVEEAVRITNPLDQLALGDTYQFTAVYTNNIGQTESANINWSSSDENLLSINSDGLATGLQKGDLTITAEVAINGKTVYDTRALSVTDSTIITLPEIRMGVLESTSTYQLEGSFTMREENNQIILEFGSDYEASTALPGLYIYLTNNPNTSVGAYEIGMVQDYSGAHAYMLPASEVELYEYSHVLYFCKPFNVKVGDGELN
ncbi:MAG: Ig-like domain-containing protein [Saprospiraceae bacterium]|nr:Ig-like domain-containing protein [Saprospiraceae bacterium]